MLVLSGTILCRKNGEIVVIEVGYEHLPDLCSHCGNVGHIVNTYAEESPSFARVSSSLDEVEVVDSDLNQIVNVPAPIVVEQVIAPIVQEVEQNISSAIASVQF
ncbi:hypothetical protein ACLB2K_009869 [Fragaria x ananassa]